MELMGTCLDKLLRTTRTPVPEPILGKIAVSVSYVNVNFVDYFVRSFYNQLTIMLLIYDNVILFLKHGHKEKLL